MESPIECIVKDGIQYITVTSIGKTLGIANRTIHKVIKNNQDNFEDCLTRYLTCRVDGNPLEQVCLSKEGVINLLLLISTKRYPEEKQQRIKDFKKWARKVLINAYDQQFNNLITASKEEQREITKSMHKTLMPALTNAYALKYKSGIVPRTIYMYENMMLNTVSFGYHERDMRNRVSHEELVRLSIAQGADLTLLECGILSITDRADKINSIIAKYYISAPNQLSKLESFM